MLLMLMMLLSICGLPVLATGTESSEPAAITTEETAAATEPATEPEDIVNKVESTETAPEDAGGMKASAELIALLKYEEGFSKYPFWDYSQYTVGYGTRCPDDMLSEYRSRGITEHEAELLLKEHLENTEWLLNSKIIDKYGLTLTQPQFDALVTFTYNMGSGWITSPNQNIHKQIASGATGNVLIDALTRWCKAGGSVHSVLLRRRLSEARMYLEGVYSHSVPANYCYVLYDGNGGSTSQSAQGYNTEMPDAVPKCVATYGSNTFEGWYTSPVGGEKVETLTAAVKGKTLYAHWREVKPTEPDKLETSVVVTVTANDVNLRKGPGTNYARIGSTSKGKTFTITQVVEGGNYIWGYYGTGWICLQYTNYSTVSQKPAEPEATEPQPTEPTEPAPTTPPTAAPTEPAAEPATGKINANPFLRVRKGPGTGYAVVDTLQNGEKVTILQQKSVGSSIWGEISNGWISMSYVIMDTPAQPENTPSGDQTAAGKKGTITCGLLNVRSGAGVNYSIVGQYRKNETVTVTEEKTVGSTTWGKTVKGWVSMDYVSLQSTESSTPAAPDSGSTAAQITGTVTSNDVLRIRSGAGTSYSVVGYLNSGTKVTITEKKTVGNTTWGKTAKGWVSMDYIREDSSSGETPNTNTEESTSVKTVTASCLCVRKAAGTGNTVVGYLYKGSKVTVTETVTVGSSQWGKIATGWICLDYAK